MIIFMTIQKNINGMNKKLIFDSVESTLKQQKFDTIQKQNIKKCLSESKYSRLNYKEIIHFQV